jgi:hypothetical protein
VLRCLRQRLRGTPATHNQAYTARHHVTAAIAFLDWLAARGLTLATCAQGDLDAWMATASTARKSTTGHFVRWALSRKHTSVDFPATRWNGPARTLDTEAPLGPGPAAPPRQGPRPRRQVRRAPPPALRPSAVSHQPPDPR